MTHREAVLIKLLLKEFAIQMHDPGSSLLTREETRSALQWLAILIGKFDTESADSLSQFVPLLDAEDLDSPLATSKFDRVFTIVAESFFAHYQSIQPREPKSDGV